MEQPVPTIEIILPAEALKPGDQLADIADDLQRLIDIADQFGAIKRFSKLPVAVGIPFNDQMVVMRDNQTAAQVVQNFMNRVLMEKEAKHQQKIEQIEADATLEPDNSDRAIDGVVEVGHGPVTDIELIKKPLPEAALDAPQEGHA